MKQVRVTMRRLVEAFRPLYLRFEEPAEFVERAQRAVAEL